MAERMSGTLAEAAARAPVGPAGELTAEDLEAAYARALEALETVETRVPNLVTADPDPVLAERRGAGLDGSRGDNQSHQTDRPDSPESSAGHRSEEPPVHPRDVVEAALFVGGGPLPVRRLAQLFSGEASAQSVEALIDELNGLYQQQGRPYRVELVSGGYQLALLPEYEKVRHRVHGTSPREVKLSQEALEILAFVAYRQPVRRDQFEALGRPQAPVMLRQLLRRGLVTLKRGTGGADEPTYATSDRFLEVFGLRSLRDLPFPEDLHFK
jgi:segregation and condensation protein B